MSRLKGITNKMEKGKITTFQLFSLIVLFELGTAMMIPLGIDAKQDAWLSILIAMIGGILIFSVYAYLNHCYPKLLLTGYVKRIIGKYFGFVICLLYIFFFIYGAARDLRDGVELLLLSYGDTPIFVLSLIMMMVVCYALFLGIEVLSRIGEIYFLLFLFTGVVSIAFLFLSDVVHFENVQPVLEEGWEPVFSSVLTQTAMFPFGEMICFTMILPYLNQVKYGLKVGVFAIILSGVALAFIVLLEIAVLGINNMEQTVFPFLDMMEKIEIGEIVQRLDAFVVISLIINDFFKISIFSYAAVIGASDIFKVNKNKLFIPIGILILIVSLLIAKNLQLHLEQGRFALKYIFPPFVIGIPLLLMIIEMVRRKFNNKLKSHQPSPHSNGEG
ncbi:GerAB/ArcD/ProY family transporter [Bacillus sp. 03113]|uniref:GerAB/ArcD/ProY family transporter n=1 Tax=Bacillus sp. 03113 TaxID=2578211 RepID=UPI0015E889CD|nr:GerAB/ArcD/ProY family transporter [Bacillus sp. 03113]